MAKKQNEKWVDLVGEEVCHILSKQHGRAFDFYQGGPYPQGGNTFLTIQFNESRLRDIKPTIVTDRQDKRFGFVIQGNFVSQGERKGDILLSTYLGVIDDPISY